MAFPSCKLLVGLGNPGVTYQNTRHNLGFMVIDALAQSRRAAMNYIKEKVYLMGRDTINGSPVILVKPLTYMNRSGEAVAELCRIFEISPPNILVVADDVNLPFGKLRLRPGGSNGGHNGLASIIAALGRSDFPRLRIGIGREGIADLVKFVLSEFEMPERKELDDILKRSAQACTTFVVEGINKTMNRFN
jgi:PTH1 family peptidyl-tRNA hydrolase